jgi:glucose-1-phosphate thymidylyltransferase
VIKIKALVLGAGYGTRLYPLTQDTPKQLLEVGGKTILGHILEKIDQIPEVKEIMVVTNHRFYDQFRIWLNHNPRTKNIKLINDGTISNNDRLGAVGDINFVLKEEDINDDLLVIAGDNLFGFELKNFIGNFHQHGNSLVAFHDLKDHEKIKKKYGVGVLDGDKVIEFQEKPWVPKSSLAATACYIFKKEDLNHVEKSISLGKADNPGDLVKYLVKESKVHGYVFDEHWFDVGSFESLEEAKKVYK